MLQEWVFSLAYITDYTGQKEAVLIKSSFSHIDKSKGW